MSNETYGDIISRLSASILTLAPDIPMGAEELQAQITARGIDGFIRDAGGHVAALSEIAELLSRPGKGGAERGNG